MLPNYRPIILKPRNNSAIDLMQSFGKVKEITKMMIQNHSDIFSVSSFDLVALF